MADSLFSAAEGVESTLDTPETVVEDPTKTGGDGGDGNGISADPSVTPESEDMAAFTATAIPESVLGGKFKTVEDLVKGYQESSQHGHALNERFKGFAGAPVDEEGNAVAYDFSEVEGFEDFEPDEGLMGVVNEIGQEAGASQEVMSKLLGQVYLPAINAVVQGNQQEEFARLDATYGSEDLRNQMISNNLDWATQTLPESDPRYGPETTREDFLNELGSTAVGQIALDILRDQYKKNTLPSNVNAPTPAYGEEEYQSERRLMQSGQADQAMVDRVMAYVSRKAGG